MQKHRKSCDFRCFGGDKRDRTADLLNAMETKYKNSLNVFEIIYNLTGFSGFFISKNLMNLWCFDMFRCHSGQNSGQIHIFDLTIQEDNCSGDCLCRDD